MPTGQVDKTMTSYAKVFSSFWSVAGGCEFEACALKLHCRGQGLVLEGLLFLSAAPLPPPSTSLDYFVPQLPHFEHKHHPMDSWRQRIKMGEETFQKVSDVKQVRYTVVHR